MTSLQDSYFRVIDYLRISVTDRCNLRCLYCMPPEGADLFKTSDILSYEEITRIVSVAAGLGVRKVRITGGEPLARKDISFLVASLRKIHGIKDISMTTNGAYLATHARELAEAGLDRVNVSIDSFRPEKYREITRGGELDHVLQGLAAAGEAGLHPVKINMVPIRGLNDGEIPDFARLTINSEYHVRFIECMPAGARNFWDPQKYIPTAEIRGIIETISPLTPVRTRKHGPSKYFRLKEARGVIGFISALTHHFCGDCNRLRLTAEGKLRPCLFSETEIDLRSAMRSGASDLEVERLLKLAIEVKPKEHNLSAAVPERLGSCQPSSSVLSQKPRKPMSKIGG